MDHEKWYLILEKWKRFLHSCHQKNHLKKFYYEAKIQHLYDIAHMQIINLDDKDHEKSLPYSDGSVSIIVVYL